MSAGIATGIGVGLLTAACWRAWRLLCLPPAPKSATTKRRSGLRRWLAEQTVAFERLVARRRTLDDDQRWEQLLNALSRDVRSGASLTMAIETACTEPTALAPLATWWYSRAVGADSLTNRRSDGGLIQSHPATSSRRFDLRPPKKASADQKRPDRLALATLDVLIELGGRPGIALDRAASTLAQRRALAAERRAHAAQARISARVLGAVAPGFACWTIATDDDVRAFLIGSPAGWVCLTIGATLSLTGARWMHRLVQR